MVQPSRDYCRIYPVALFAALSLFSTPIAAQTESGQDTRLRLDQQIERQRADREAKAVEEAEALNSVPSSMVIDGKTYSVGNNVNEIGQALYVAVARKQWRDVRRFLAAYEALDGHDPMLALYARGAVARNDGDLGDAERRYRELLAIKPDFLPGQLELARTLFDNRKDREAQRAFERARTELSGGGAEAESVIRTVDAFLAALKRRRGWQGSIAIGPTYSTNLNQSSASYTCLLAAQDGTCLFDRQVPDPIKAAGINFEATLSRDVPLAGHSGIRARALLYGDVFPEHHDYSQGTLIGRLGYQYQTARNALSLSPSFEIGSLGSSVLYQAWGANAEWTHTVSRRALFRIEGNYRNFRYRLNGFHPQDGPLTDISLTGWYVLSPAWTLFGGPDFAAKDTPDPVDAYRQWGARLGVSKAFGASASLLILGSYRHRRYRAYSELFEAQREDDQFNATAVARFPVFKFGGPVPEIIVQHNRINSNIDWLYTYKRTTASVRLSHAF